MDLKRFCPVLCLDSRERFSSAGQGSAPGQSLRRADGHPVAVQPILSLDALAEYAYTDRVSGKDVEPGDYLEAPSLPSTIYARSIHRAGRMYLQYWLWFAKDRGHEGDWESVVMRMGAHVPDLVGYAQHSAGQQRSWPRVRREGGRPIVYVARGSHASYFEAGTYILPSWRSLDHANGRRREDPQLEVIDSPDWMLWPGRWGRDAKSPVSPSQHWAWHDPAGWLASLPRECLSRKLF